MSLYEQNMKFIKENAPVLYDTINSESPIYQSKIQKVDKQLNYIVEREGVRCFIHSIYNADREIEEMFRPVDKNAGTLILFGFGCGVYLDYMRKNYSKVENLVVIEPDLELFREVLHDIDIINLIRSIKNVTFLINKSFEHAVEYLGNLVLGNFRSVISLAFNISYRTLYKGYFENIYDSLIDTIQRTHVNLMTSFYWVNNWAINIFRSFTEQSITVNGSFLEGFEGITAIIVSAGPSLDKNIHLLKEVGNRALIVAVGSAIKILHNKGIIPHLRIAVDGSPKEKLIFENIDTSAAPLIYSRVLYYDILPEYSGKRLSLIANSDFLSKYIYKLSGLDYTEIVSGFSVANQALDLLCKAKCRTIVFMGQDLCYTGERIHAQGSWNENNKYDFNSKSYIPMVDIYGNKVYTDKPFLGMKSMLEDTIRSYPDIQYINATQGGLNIEGTAVRDFEDMLGELTDEYDAAGIVRKAISGNETKEYSKEVIYKSILTIENEVDEIISVNSKRKKSVKKLFETKGRKSNLDRLMLEIDSLERFEKELIDKKFYNEVIRGELSRITDLIYLGYQYNGNDREKKIEADIEVLKTQSDILMEYCQLLKKLIEEYKMNYHTGNNKTWFEEIEKYIVTT